MKVFLLLAIALFSFPGFASLNEILSKPEHADCLEAYQELTEIQITTTSSCSSCTSYMVTGKIKQGGAAIIEAHEQRYGYRGGYQNVTSCTVKFVE